MARMAPQEGMQAQGPGGGEAQKLRGGRIPDMVHAWPWEGGGNAW